MAAALATEDLDVVSEEDIIAEEQDIVAEEEEEWESPFGADLTLEDLEAMGVIYIMRQARLAMPRSAHFTPEEIGDPNIWYAEPNHVVMLSNVGTTVTDSAYRRLIGAIQAAPINQVTHIIIPFHIDIGNINTTTFTVVGVRNGATVVLIGDHPGAENGQSVISDTHGGSSDGMVGGGGVTRAFRVRGDGTAQSGLVFRNIILQTAGQAPASTPDLAPTPIPIAQQTNNARGGGVAIEPGAVAGITVAGGGGHLILCRGAVIRNSSTDNNGPVDVQTDGRFTMMPGSEMHTNVASNSGGAVHVNTRGIFTMHGGVLRNNLARGERTDQPLQRAVGGAVFIQNGGTFNMYDGEIFENQARLGENAASPSATDAIVTSSGGAVFVTGNASTFNMYGGTVRDNEAIRTRASNVVTQDNRYAFRAGNGGGVYVTARAAFNMYNGYIENNIATAVGTAVSSPNGGDALNLSNGGGVYLTGAGTRFHMHNGTIRKNEAVRTVNSVPTMPGIPLASSMTVLAGNGGGVHVYDDAIFTMDDGSIYENTATATGTDPANNTSNLFLLSNGGGVMVAGTAVVGSAEAARFFMNGGTVRDNHAIGTAASASTFSGNGGGVSVMSRVQFHMTGGVISGNTATDRNTTTTPSQGLRRGNGAGVYLGRGFSTGLSLRMTGGEIRDHTTVTRHGVGVFMTGGRVEIGGTARIENNHSPNNGGGIFVEETGTLSISGGTISGNTAQQDGGGIFLSATGIVLNMQSGEIRDNLANNGGGLFAPHANLSANLSNITINRAAVFTGNVARNGLRINTPLAVAVRPRIDPGTVSITGWTVLDEIPSGSGNFGEVAPHAFTNYDINAEGLPFWRVTYAVGEGEGEIGAMTGRNDFPVVSGAFVPDGTMTSFNADPLPFFDEWEIWTRESEVEEGGNPVAFELQDNTDEHPLQHMVEQHTHVVGNFKARLSITYHPNGGVGEPYVQWVPPGIYRVDHQVTHAGIDGVPYRFLGWNTEPDGSGISYANGNDIIIEENVILYAQWGQATTTLTVSKAVSGEMANQTLAFEFTIRFTNANGEPLAEGRQFPYTGSSEDTLTLNGNGSAVFRLTHGQSIYIAGVPLGYGVQIIETTDANYATSFTDSARPEDTFFGTNTEAQIIAENHAFRFTNERVFVPSTGFNLGNLGAMLLLSVLVSLFAMLAFALGFFYRRKSPNGV